jgi:hypothetical protein
VTFGGWYARADGADARADARPAKQWPPWARILQRRRLDGEAGLGDTAERIVGALGGEHFKFWFRLVTGHDCKCASRKDWLNAKYPYPYP